jgi:MFS family permease
VAASETGNYHKRLHCQCQADTFLPVRKGADDSPRLHAFAAVTGAPGDVRRQFLVVCLQTTLFQGAIFLIRPTASYRALELGVPVGWLGALAAAFAIVPLVLALPAGDAVDRWGERAVLLAGAVLVCTGAGMFLFVAHSFAMVLLATALLGAGHLLSVVGQQALVANITPGRNLDSAYGYYTFAGALGQAIGPGLLGLFDGGHSMPATQGAFLAGLALALALLAGTFFTRASARSTEPPRLLAERRLPALLRTPHLLRALTVSGIVLASMEITIVYLPALGTEQNISVSLVSGLLTVRALASMVSRFMLGRLSRLFGRRLLLTSAIVITGVATAVLATPVLTVALLVAAAALGFGFGMCQPLTLSWLAEISPAGSRGRVMSVRLAGNRLAQVLIPSCVGLLAAGLGAAGVLWLTAAMTVGAGVLARSVPLDAAGDTESEVDG